MLNLTMHDEWGQKMYRHKLREIAKFACPTAQLFGTLQGKMKNIERFKQEIAIMKMMDRHPFMPAMLAGSFTEETWFLIKLDHSRDHL